MQARYINLNSKTTTEQQQKPTGFLILKCSLRTCAAILLTTLGPSDFQGRLVMVQRLVCYRPSLSKACKWNRPSHTALQAIEERWQMLMYKSRGIRFRQKTPFYMASLFVLNPYVLWVHVSLCANEFEKNQTSTEPNKNHSKRLDRILDYKAFRGSTTLQLEDCKVGCCRL